MNGGFQLRTNGAGGGGEAEEQVVEEVVVRAVAPLTRAGEGLIESAHGQVGRPPHLAVRWKAAETPQLWSGPRRGPQAKVRLHAAEAVLRGA